MESKKLFLIDVSTQLSEFCQHAEESKIISPKFAKDFNRLKEISTRLIWNLNDKEDILVWLSNLLECSKTLSSVITYFPKLMPELVHRLLTVSQKSETKDLELLLIVEILISYKIASFWKSPLSIFMSYISRRISEYTSEQTIELALKILFHWCCESQILPTDLCEEKIILTFRSSNKITIKFYAYKLIGLNHGIIDMDSFLLKFFNQDEVNHYQKISNIQTWRLKSLDTGCQSGISVNLHKSFDRSNFKSDLMPILGLPFEVSKDSTIEQLPTNDLVLTNSTLRNLESLTYGYLCNNLVVLSGSVGCGKTRLIEFVANQMGRKKSPQLLKLQLGEQTDSKSLLGTYVCSDKPGEFVWQAGTLTQAVQFGSWILLEDIDQAPSDVISTLLTLVKSKSLAIPGHCKSIPMKKGFQIFATKRSNFGQRNSVLKMLLKQSHIVNMISATKDELIEIIEKKYDRLVSITNKLVDIYCMLSTDSNLQTDEDVHFIEVNGRKNTPRDLFKWCNRLNEYYKTSNTAPTVEFVFLHALQCFCTSNPSFEARQSIAYALGAKLGLTKAKVEYYLLKYKPNIRTGDTTLSIGCTTMVKRIDNKISMKVDSQNFAFTMHSLRLLEDITVCVKNFEPVLLVGETGGGKTSTVQYLANQCGCKLNVVNMSQQSDIADLLGGFKPIDIRETVRPIQDAFVELFIDTYSRKQNVKFLGHVHQCFSNRRWSILIKLMTHCCTKAIERKQKEEESESIHQEITKRWIQIQGDIKSLETKISSQTGLVFSFIEGVLVQSLKKGDWILLDEINLASTETLECLSGLLDSQSGSTVLSERGDIEEIKRDDNFRIFACMNPATDVGKKDLPYSIRNRFTEIYVDELKDEGDLKTLVACYLKKMNISSAIIDGIVNFYLDIRSLAKDKLIDGSGHRPHFSLRTLCRGLEYAIKQTYMAPMRAVYEGLCTSFLTQLNRASYPKVEGTILKHVFKTVSNIKSFLGRTIPQPQENMINAEGYWIPIGAKKVLEDESYVLTKSVKKNLKDLARVVAGGQFPVLIQGETSVGKTSLISYLANLTGNQCMRINNHEHTDIQEYVGCYGADSNGNLVFKEGVLVTAMRQGHWIILDELNLAPSDVLEALNRLLDDNRELFIAETQETVKAHPKFILFATQNPPGHYGGRKALSRAFRNRFIELHFDEIPQKELEEILHKRCHLPESYSKKFVKVMHDLQVRRNNSGIFAGKQSFMTLRDLFRWAERYRLSSDGADSFYDWEQCICEDGFMLIAGRCRHSEESEVIKEVLESNFKKKIIIEDLFDGSCLSSKQLSEQILSSLLDEFQHIVWTKNMKRLAILAGRALQYNEPLLLIGETGCGKTTICQLFAKMNNSKLYAVNCHMHTEAADFLGGLRPVRSKEPGEQKLFEWSNGPLINSMLEGQMFLIDEISLADDSVLERLNSILEPERLLVLSEKGETQNSGQIDVIKAAEGFRLFATMNPGGDYGKKELSPALRNRFTEVWCSPSDCYEDLKAIIEHNIHEDIKVQNVNESDGSGIGKLIVEFLQWFRDTEIGSRFVVSIRDLLSWVQFINTLCSPSERTSSPEEAYIHGACLVFIDAIGSGNTAQSNSSDIISIRKKFLVYLCSQFGWKDFSLYEGDIFSNEKYFGLGKFQITKGLAMDKESKTQFSFKSSTTKRNALHLLRGLQLSRPILLEGSPGVGKTSLVVALARASCNPITRINLSEETDISDLFGSDLPVEGGEAGQFSWKDGPLLKALKSGHWVVFDELNLASQSVLEGLNACFDHRAELYIPELNKTFTVQKETRIFACQNPLHQGGGRKGLPKSFLNRFTKVYVDAMTIEDLQIIIQSAYPNISEDVISKMVVFNSKLQGEVVDKGLWGKKGGPWEFNIRDMTRWCELTRHDSNLDAGDFVRLLYQSRMRDPMDKEKVLMLYKEVFGDESIELRCKTQQCSFEVTSTEVKIGYSKVTRNERKKNGVALSSKPLEMLRGNLPYLEGITKCVEMNWMTILVGGESSCKNSMVKVLSELTGNELNILSMNNSTDSSDFIGGFEQLNYETHVSKLANELLVIIDDLMVDVLPSSQEKDDKADVLMRLKLKIADKGKTKVEEKMNSLNQAIQVLEKTGMISNEETLGSFKSKHQTLERMISNNSSAMGQFEWVDGILVTSLKQGSWLLIENVNFCSSSILDRLNGLLEPGGVLSLDERGVIDGEIPFVRPHPEFRLFLSMDAKFDEISRAMRNRGVEICILSEEDNVELDMIDCSLLSRSNNLAVESTDLIKRKLEAINSNDHTNQSAIKGQLSKYLEVCKLTGCLVECGSNVGDAMDKALAEVVPTYELMFDEEPMMPVETVQESSEKSKYIHLIPSVKQWCDSLHQARVSHSLIPFTLSVDENQKLIAALKVFLESSSMDELNGMHVYLKKILPVNLLYAWNTFIDSISMLSNEVQTCDGSTRIFQLINSGSENPLADQLKRLSILFHLITFNFHPTVDQFGRNSLMMLSKAFKEGKRNASTLPHKSIMNVFVFYKSLMSYIYDEWLRNVHFESTEHLAKMFEGLSWLKRLLEYLTNENTTSSMLDTTPSFSFSTLVLHWKWCQENFFKFLQPSAELSFTMDQLSNLLGEDSKNYELLAISKAFSRPKAFQCIEQSNLVVNLGESYQYLDTKEGSNNLKEQLLSCLAEVHLNQNHDYFTVKKSVQKIIEEANLLPDKRQTIRQETEILQSLYQQLFQNICHTTSHQLNRNEITKDLDQLVKYSLQLSKDVQLPGVLAVLHHLKGGEETNLIDQYLPHLQSSLACQRFQDLANIFALDYDGPKIEHSILPLEVTVLKYLECLVTPYENTVALNIPLKSCEDTFQQLSQLRSLLWAGGDVMMNSKHKFLEQSITGSMRKILSLCQAHCLVSKHDGLLDALNQFKSTLSHSDVSQFIECLQTVKNNVNFSTGVEHVVQNLIGYLQSSKQDDHLNLNVQCGMLLAYSSLMEFHVGKIHLKYDPVEEVLLRKQHLQSQLSDVQDELEIRYKTQHIWTGSPSCVKNEETGLIQVQHLTFNPLMAETLLKSQDNVSTQLHECQEEDIARPQETQYNSLYADFQHFEETVGRLDNNLVLVKELHNAVSDETAVTNQTKNLLVRGLTFTNSLTQYINKLESYRLYQDLTTTPIAALKNLQNGILLLLNQLRKRIQDEKFTTKSKLTPAEFCCKLLDIVWYLPSEAHKALIEPRLFAASKYLASLESNKLTSLPHDLLLMSLQCLQNDFQQNLNIRSTSQTKKESIQQFRHVMSAFYQLWCNRKQYELEEEARKASLYKYKTKVHCESKTEEESSDEKTKELFPTYDNTYEDVIPRDILNQQKEVENEATENDVSNESEAAAPRVDERLVYKAMRSIFFKKDVVEQSDVLMEVYHQMWYLLKMPEVVYGMTTDKHFASLLLLVTQLQSHVTSVGPTDALNFNIYEDFHLDEARKARGILEKFDGFVEQLLCEFEDHPALLQIRKLIERVLSLSICSPLMKFVTGFELLLKQSQDWEAYAGSHVSLKNHLEDVTRQIVLWRKMELKTWQNLLQKSEQKMEDSVAKWMFHFWNLLQEIETSDDETNCKEKKDEYFQALRQFFESGNIGDFESRIELVEIFFKYICQLDETQDLQRVTWNSLQYYSQFLPAVNQHKLALKKPIEKELKDYVKIAKWSDINYYALKLAVEKSHRTLTKFVRKYEGVLNEPITQFLQDATKQTKPSEKQKNFHIKLLQDNLTFAIVKPPSEKEGYLAKTDSLCHKMRKHFETVKGNTMYGDLIEGIDEMTGDIIESIQDFQKENPLSLPKEKQKEARSNLQQRKRKALATLFKELKMIGISYRIGNIDVTEEATLFQSPKLESKLASWNDIRECIDTCNFYYFQSVARNALFHNALCAPCKEIGPNEIARFKGLTSFLMTSAFNQRKDLDKLLVNENRISTLIESLSEIQRSSDQKETILPCQTTTKHWLYTINETIYMAEHHLNDFTNLINTCPEENQFSFPFLKEELSEMALSVRNEKIVLDAVTTANECQAMLKVMREESVKYDDSLCSWAHWTYIENCVEKFKQICQQLELMAVNFRSPNISEGNTMFSKMTELQHHISNMTSSFEEVDISSAVEQETNSNTGLLPQCAEHLIKQILISIQNIVKSTEDFKEKNVQEEDTGLWKGQFSPLLTKKFIFHLSCLDISTITSLTEQFISQLNEQNIDQSYCLNVVSMVKEALQWLQFYTFHTLMLHRTSCKMLYVLLGIFTDLLKQGYCSPPEEDENATGEGATEFEDIHDGGLGSGEGVKDVSDQIETEDQVEDTKHEKSEEKQEDQQQDDIKEEKDGIEMTDDFESQLQDMEIKESDDEKDDEENESEGEEPDKQMGDVEDDNQTNEVDENMWGSDDEEEKEEKNNEKEEKEAQGQNGESKSELVAKDDNRGEQEGDEPKNEKEQKDEGGQNENEEDHPINEMDDDVTDDVMQEEDHGKQEDERKNDVEDLPDDLNLDGEEEEEGGDNEDEEMKGEDEEKNEEQKEDGGFKEDIAMEEANDDEVNENQEEDGNQEEAKKDEIDSNEKNDEGEENNEDDNEKDPSLEERVPTDHDQQQPVEGVEFAPEDVEQNSSTVDDATTQQQADESNDQGQGKADMQGQEGHLGSSDSVSKQQTDKQKGRKRKDFQRSHEDRSLETSNISEAKKRKAFDATDGMDENEDDSRNQLDQDETYQHLKNDDDKHDAHVVDTATEQQIERLDGQQNIPLDDDEEEGENESESDVEMKEAGEEDEKEEKRKKDFKGTQGKFDNEKVLHKEEKMNEDEKEERGSDDEQEMKSDEDERNLKSEFFTNRIHLGASMASVQEQETLVTSLRKELEQDLTVWSTNQKTMSLTDRDSMELWLKYDRLTSSLAMQLCEQLRLVIEPTLASKMRGDYRTGKRLNMRKVIPYIASQFRKDKIWLRRTKKSKRDYQIVLAVDDSSSMADNHSKQLAFESLSVISNALRWLEAGELAVCSFGEDTKLLHPFEENFNEQSGASILKQFTFNQKKTKIAHLMKMCTLLFDDAKRKQRSNSNSQISQLLLIVSDGRGIFLEGKELVQRTAMQAREAGIFTVFLILDDPKNKDSILDIKVPVFKPGTALPEIKSYIDEFPFPFYVLLRDINSLPNVLSDALRQWFELVTQAT